MKLNLFIVYVLYHLVRHRREFSRVVTSSNSAFTFSRTVRLGLLTAGYLFIALPMDIYNVIKYVKAAEPPMEYNWDVIHENVMSLTIYFGNFYLTSAILDWDNPLCSIKYT